MGFINSIRKFFGFETKKVVKEEPAVFIPYSQVLNETTVSPVTYETTAAKLPEDSFVTKDLVSKPKPKKKKKAAPAVKEEKPKINVTKKKKAVKK